MHGLAALVAGDASDEPAPVAPEPDRQQPHEDDEVYVVLEGTGVLEIEGETVELKEGQAAFVPAGADHRFVGYEQLSVLVIFAKRDVDMSH